MKLFSKLFGKEENKTQELNIEIQDTVPQSIEDVEIKIPNNATQMQKINLRKEKINKICLEKKPILNNLTAKVKVVLDYSASMDWLYENGSVQETLNKLLPLALKFDDDGEMELFIFENGYNELKPLTIDNFDDYIRKEKILRKYDMGGTYYAPIIKHLTKTQKDKTPVFVIFITDGDCADNRNSEKAIRDAAEKSIFWQFVGIGNSSFSFLEKLDNMQGRIIDNADFLKVSDMSNADDDKLYEALLGEFPEWLKEARKKGLCN